MLVIKNLPASAGDMRDMVSISGLGRSPFFSMQKCWSGLPYPTPGGSSWPGDGTWVSCIGRWIPYHGATREAPYMLSRPQQIELFYMLGNKTSGWLALLWHLLYCSDLWLNIYCLLGMLILIIKLWTFMFRSFWGHMFHLQRVLVAPHPKTRYCQPFEF